VASAPGVSPAPSVPLRALDRPVAESRHRVSRVLAAPALARERGSLPTDLFRYGLRERWRDRARFLLYRLTTPSQPEHWRVVRLGPLTFATHGILRPFRVMRKLAWMLGRRSGGSGWAGR
jgi:hypothetical protein